jgi:hypothetical protein
VYLARSLATNPHHRFLTLVRRSRNPCLVGLSGIVLHETENAFKLITRKNRLKRTLCPHSFPSLSHRWSLQSSRNKTPSSHSPYRSTRHFLRRLLCGIPHRRSNKKIQKRCGRCSINPTSSLIFTETSFVSVLRIGRIGNLKPRRRSSCEARVATFFVHHRFRRHPHHIYARLIYLWIGWLGVSCVRDRKAL